MVASSVEALGMDWYGRWAMSLTAGLVAGAAAWALGGWARVAPRLGSPSVVLGGTRLGATMLLFDVLFYTLSLLARDRPAAPAELVLPAVRGSHRSRLKVALPRGGRRMEKSPCPAGPPRP